MCILLPGSCWVSVTGRTEVVELAREDSSPGAGEIQQTRPRLLKAVVAFLVAGACLTLMSAGAAAAGLPGTGNKPLVQAAVPTPPVPPVGNLAVNANRSQGSPSASAPASVQT